LTQGRLAQTVSTQQGLVAQLRAARLKVAQLMGRAVKDDATPQEQLNFVATNLGELEARALENSPALQKLQAQQHAQKAEISERKAEMLPEIYLRIEHQRSQYDSSVMYSGGVNRAYVGLASRFGAGLSNITQQESLTKRLESIEADAEAVKRNLTEQIQTDFEVWSSLKARIPELELATQATRKTAEAWDRQFLAGRKSWMEVMNTARELMQAEMELVDARSNLVNAKWRLSILGYGIGKTLEMQSLAEPAEIQGGQK
jgi:adhesin transport system outer membrane protein